MIPILTEPTSASFHVLGREGQIGSGGEVLVFDILLLATSTLVGVSSLGFLRDPWPQVSGLSLVFWAVSSFLWPFQRPLLTLRLKLHSFVRAHCGEQICHPWLISASASESDEIPELIFNNLNAIVCGG
jgi:hypothetical protein